VCCENSLARIPARKANDAVPHTCIECSCYPLVMIIPHCNSHRDDASGDEALARERRQADELSASKY